MRIALMLTLALCTLSTCHWEKAMTKYDGAGARKSKHTVWTTPTTDRKLDVELKDQQETKVTTVDLKNVNLFSLPRNYFGTVVYVDEENDLVVNLLFDSEAEKGDTLVAKGYFSRMDKRSFNELEVLIPMSAYNEYGRNDVTIGDTTITVPIKTSFDFIHYQLQSAVDLFQNDTSLVDSLDLAQLEPIYIDGEQMGALDSLDTTLVFNDIALYQNTREVLMLSGQMSLPSGSSIRFHSLSDPLPLIPMAIGALACFGVKKYREHKKERQLAEQKRLQALARQGR